MRSKLGTLTVLALALAACRSDLDASGGTEGGTDSDGSTSGSTSDGTTNGSSTTTAGTSTTDPTATGSSSTSTTGSTTSSTSSTGSTGPVDTCGDGTEDAGEECDDGNNVDADGCEADCTLPACENGIYDPGELCWPTPVTLDDTANPGELVVGTIDLNARDDLAWIEGGSAHVFLGRDDLTFQSKTPFALDTPATNGWLVLVDLDDEGRLDLAVSDPDNDKFVVADGLGDGTFGNKYVGTPNADIFGMATDFGFGEFAMANFDETDNYPEVYFFFGDESWGTPTGMVFPMCPFCSWFEWTAAGSTVSGPSNPFTGDFNGDGKADRGKWWASTVPALGLYAGNGDGTFSWIRGTDFPGMQFPSRKKVADLNGDGADDAINMYASKLLVVPGVPDGQAEPAIFEVITSYDMHDVAFTDVDADGDTDAVACRTDGGMLLIQNDGGGNFTEKTVDLAATCDRVVTGDFDGDGLPDLAVRIMDGGVTVLHFRP